jgi:hypothetical protein
MPSKYVDFRRALPALCVRFELDISALTFDDFVFVVGAWLTPPTPASA